MNNQKELDYNFVRYSSTIVIPSKVQRILERNIPVKELRKIHPNRTVAIEKCLIFLSFLVSTNYTDNKFKTLHSQLLIDIFGKNYRRIVDLLLVGTEKGSIIEIKQNNDGEEIYKEGEYSKQYSLCEAFYEKGTNIYKLTDKQMINQRGKQLWKMHSEATDNPIAKNLIKLYPYLDVPFKKDIMDMGKYLVEQGYTKKGKKLKMLGKNTKKTYKDAEKYSFVEENYKKYDDLCLKLGYMIPIISEFGGRVTDSFNLIPSWIRSMITVDGEQMVEVDFKCLHPNIASTLFGGSKRNVQHSIVAEALNIDLNIVKTQHLSFFNEEVWQMKQSPLYAYYEVYEPTMLKNIINMKFKDGYTSVTRLLFEKETEIMTKVIQTLNAEGIYVLYIYDALQCKESDVNRVAEVMNQTILECGVNTYTSITLNKATVTTSNEKPTLTTTPTVKVQEKLSNEATEGRVVNSVLSIFNIYKEMKTKYMSMEDMNFDCTNIYLAIQGEEKGTVYTTEEVIRKYVSRYTTPKQVEVIVSPKGYNTVDMEQDYIKSGIIKEEVIEEDDEYTIEDWELTATSGNNITDDLY